jgi:hypothetical protein
VSTTDADSSLPDTPWPSAPPGTPGLKVGFPGAHELAGPTPRVSHRAKVLLLLAGLGVLTVLLVVVALLATPGSAPYCNPLKCQGPPIRHPGLQQSAAGSPVAAGILYTNSQGFSVRYLSGADVSTSAGGINLTYDYSNGGQSSLEVVGGTADGETPETAVADVANTDFPGVQPTYELPNPLIGYQPAFGAGRLHTEGSADGSTQTDQVVVSAAIKDNFGILVLEEGSLLPTVGSNSPYYNGHPSPAGVNMAYGIGDFIVNRIRFP